MDRQFFLVGSFSWTVDKSCSGSFAFATLTGRLLGPFRLQMQTA